MPFRINRQKVGVTWSCPCSGDCEPNAHTEDCECSNPIETHQELIEFLGTHGSLKRYTVGKEKHENGAVHWHAFAHYQDALNQVGDTAMRMFDFKGVHPNIKAGNPGKGWEAYCVKDGDFVSNYWKVDVFATAREKRTWTEASMLLWEQVPKFMFQHAASAEKNFKKHKRVPRPATVYLGPYQQFLHDAVAEWDHTKKTLILQGKPGVGKTQFARYLLQHKCGGYHYVKAKLEKGMKAYGGEPAYLLDDCGQAISELEYDDQNALLDVEAGGDITARYEDIVRAPIPMIILANRDVGIRTGEASELKRRFTFIELK